MSDSVELIPDDQSDKTMEEVQQATTALAPPAGVGRPLPARNGLPRSVRDVIARTLACTKTVVSLYSKSTS